MKRKGFSASGFIAAALVWCLAPNSVLACATCFGRSDDGMAKGMNMGILVLLGFILSVLCGIAGFMVYLARRGAAVNGSGGDVVAAGSDNA